MFSFKKNDNYIKMLIYYEKGRLKNVIFNNIHNLIDKQINKKLNKYEYYYFISDFINYNN